jgi:murein DD-endopeptidase MepM/ murein hydrolase activator NlpD
LVAIVAFLAGRSSKRPTVAASGDTSDRAVVLSVAVQEDAGRGGAAEGDEYFLLGYEELRQRETAEADRVARALADVPVAVPVEGAVITSTYTSRRFHPILRRVRPHWGVDLAAAEGTPVRVAADGVVTHVVRSRSYGLVIDVAHGERYVTRYAHLSAALAKVGDRVEQGSVIGRVGSSGLSTGPHLHYEVFVDGRRRDPAYFLDARMGALAGEQTARVGVIPSGEVES